MGMVTEAPDVLDAVAGGLPRSEVGASYIYGIGTAVDGRDADFKISCRSKQFETPHYYLRAFRSFWASGP